MPLREEMARQGNWLFRWRSYLPLAILPMLFLALRQPGFPHGDVSICLLRAWKIGCLGLSFLGLGVRILAVGFAPGRTSGRNTAGQVAQTLNTTGIYSLVRHPLYLGNFLIFLGLILFVGSWWLAAVGVLLYGLYYERIMMAEEDFLRQSFGRTYAEWADMTPAFLPRLGGWRPPVLPFSARTVLKREYSGFFGIIASFAVVDTLRRSLAAGRLTASPRWLALFLFGLAVYVTLLILKRTTRLLKVPGR